MSGAAKTVSFSPLRAKQPSVKISLDAPYQLKWYMYLVWKAI